MQCRMIELLLGLRDVDDARKAPGLMPEKNRSRGASRNSTRISEELLSQ